MKFIELPYIPVNGKYPFRLTRIIHQEILMWTRRSGNSDGRVLMYPE